MEFCLISKPVSPASTKSIKVDPDQNKGIILISRGNRPQDYKKKSMSNSAEHEIYPAHKC